MSFFFRIEVQAPLLSSVKLTHCSKQHFYVGKLVHLRFLRAKSQKSFQVAKFDFFGYRFRRENSKGQKVVFLSQCAIKALHASCGLFLAGKVTKIT